jgi:hypothetical protein
MATITPGETPARSMPAAARRGVLTAYVALVGVASAASLLTLPAAGQFEDVLALSLLLGLAAATGSRTVDVPRLGVRLTVSDLFVFCALASQPALAAPLVALAAVAGAVIGWGKSPFSLRAAFNLTAVPLAVSVAAWTMVALDAAGSGLSAGIALLVATTAYILANLLLVSIASALKGRGFSTVFLGAGPCAAISAATSLLLGLGLVMVMDGVGVPGLLLGAAATGPLAAYACSQRELATD